MFRASRFVALPGIDRGVTFQHDALYHEKGDICSSFKVWSRENSVAGDGNEYVDGYGISLDETPYKLRVSTNAVVYQIRSLLLFFLLLRLLYNVSVLVVR